MTNGVRKALCRLCALVLALLIACCAPLALAEEEPERLLAIDLEQLKETGCCFDGALPGASFEQAAAAGLSFDEDADKSYATDQGSSRTCMLNREQVAVVDGLRTKATNFQFIEDQLACIDLYLEEEQAAQAMIDRLCEMFGAAAETSLPTQDNKIGYAMWTFEANGEAIECWASLLLRGEEAFCTTLSVMYRARIPEAA